MGEGWGGREICRYLAHVTEGIYQIDGAGFFAADGRLLVSEQQECADGGR